MATVTALTTTAFPYSDVASALEKRMTINHGQQKSKHQQGNGITMAAHCYHSLSNGVG